MRNADLITELLRIQSVLLITPCYPGADWREEEDQREKGKAGRHRWEGRWPGCWVGWLSPCSHRGQTPRAQDLPSYRLCKQAHRALIHATCWRNRQTPWLRSQKINFCGRMHCHEGFLGQDLLQKHLKTPEAVQTGLIYYSPNPSFREAAKHIWWQIRNKQFSCPSWSEIATEKTKRIRKIITAFKPPCWGQCKAFQTCSWLGAVLRGICMPKGWGMLQGDQGRTDMRSAQTERNGTCRGTGGNVKGGEKKTPLATFAEKLIFSFWWLTPSTKKKSSSFHKIQKKPCSKNSTVLLALSDPDTDSESCTFYC